MGDSEMTDEKLQELLEQIKSLADALKDTADAGLFFMSKLNPYFATVVAIGLGVKNLIGFNEPDKMEPVMKELKVLQNEIKKLDESVTRQFDGLKAFMVEYHFIKDIDIGVSTLSRFMQDTKTHAGNAESVEHFQKQYNEKTPLQFAHEVIETLKRDSANPLKMAMIADPLMTSATFDKWRNLIDTVFVEIMLIELYASGILGLSDYAQNKIKSNFEEFTADVEGWKKDYEENAHFWPQKIRQYVEGVQDENADTISDVKGEIIRKGLETVMTSNIFYIIVFRSSFEHVKYPLTSDKFFVSSDRAGSTVLIYRSTSATSEAVELMKEDVEKYREFPIIEFNGTITEDHVKAWATGENEIRNSGIVCAVLAENYVTVKSTKSKVLRNGPGHCIQSRTNGTGKYYYLLAACP